MSVNITKHSIRKNIGLSLFLCLAIALFLTACSSTQKGENKNQEKFRVVNPMLIDTLYTKEYVAEIQSVRNVEVRAMLKGIIEKIHVDEGMPVKEGQVLFTLSSRQFKEELLKANAQLKSATAELKSVEVEVKNAKRLVDKKIISGSELEIAQARKEAIQAKIEEAQSAISVATLNLSFAQVKAPFSGVINRIPNKRGSLVEEGTLLTTISNNDEVFAYFNVAEKEYLGFVKQHNTEAQKQVSLLLADNQPFPHKGTIETVENEIDKSTGNIAFRARFINPEQMLKHGASGKVLLNTDLKNVILIPQQSAFEVQENMYVYIVDEKNTVQQRKIVPQMRLGNMYVIQEGLNANDRVLYDGVQLVKEGDKIQPDFRKYSELINTQKP